MPRKKRQRIHLSETGAAVVLDLGPIEIWDGADLALLRETVTQLVQGQGRKSLAFEMQYVKYVPSGFFGLLLDCYDLGVKIQLNAPNEQIRGMLWFQRFFAEAEHDTFILHAGPAQEVPHDQPLPWTSAEDQHIWDANQDKHPLIRVYQQQQ